MFEYSYVGIITLRISNDSFSFNVIFIYKANDLNVSFYHLLFINIYKRYKQIIYFDISIKSLIKYF